jgi:hypothetical protein
MLNYLLGLLSGDIEVEVSPAYFRFMRKGKEKNLQTTIFLTDTEQPRILAVGYDQLPSPPDFKVIRVDLFKAEHYINRNIEKFDCLEAFFRYGVQIIVNRRNFIRPRVIFRHSQSLHEILCGYQRQILKHAATMAGARECLFQE